MPNGFLPLRSDLAVYGLKKATRHYSHEVASLLQLGKSTGPKETLYVNEACAGVDQERRDRLIEDAIKQLAAQQFDFAVSAVFYAHFNKRIDGADTWIQKLDAKLDGVFFAVQVVVQSDRVAASRAQLQLVSYHRESLRYVVSNDPQFFRALFSAVERWASARGCSSIEFQVSSRSPLIAYASDQPGYRVLSHGPQPNGDVHMLFVKALAPAYIHDARNWRQLARWFTKFTFFSRVPAPDPDPQSRVEAEHFEYVDLMLQPNQNIFDEELKRHQTEISVRVITMDEGCGVEPALKVLRAEKPPGQRLNLALVQAGDDEALRDVAAVKRATDIQMALQSIKWHYHHPANSNVSREWETWQDLKIGAVEKRAGAIVEVDRESYVVLVYRLLEPDGIKDKLIFFNDQSVEVLEQGTSIFFYVWDAIPWDSDSEGLGVVAGMATLESAPQLLDLNQVEERWEEVYAPHTIWPVKSGGKPFPNQFFGPQLIALELKNLRLFIHPTVVAQKPAFIKSKGVTAKDQEQWFKKFNGIPYLTLVGTLFRPHSSGSLSMPEASRLLPGWEIGNTFLSLKLSNILAEELDRRIEGTVQDFLTGRKTEQPTNLGPGNGRFAKVSKLLADQTQLKRARDDPDVFVSFSTKDQALVSMFKESFMVVTGDQYKLHIFNDEDTHQKTYGEQFYPKIARLMWNADVIVCALSQAYFVPNGAIFELEIPMIAKGSNSNQQLVIPLMVDRLGRTTLLVNLAHPEFGFDFGSCSNDNKYETDPDLMNVCLSRLMELGRRTAVEARFRSISEAIDSYLKGKRAGPSTA